MLCEKKEKKKNDVKYLFSYANPCDDIRARMFHDARQSEKSVFESEGPGLISCTVEREQPSGTVEVKRNDQPREELEIRGGNFWIFIVGYSESCREAFSYVCS